MSIWGKIIGGTAGFAIGGPIGAILGVMVGGSLTKSAKRLKSTINISTPPPIIPANNPVTTPINVNIKYILYNILNVFIKIINI